MAWGTDLTSARNAGRKRRARGVLSLIASVGLVGTMFAATVPSQAAQDQATNTVAATAATQEAKPRQITGTVYADDNWDKTRNDGEKPLAGYTVALFDAETLNGLRGQIPLDLAEHKATTGEDGRYSFAGVKDGKYHVIVYPVEATDDLSHAGGQELPQPKRLWVTEPLEINETTGHAGVDFGVIKPKLGFELTKKVNGADSVSLGVDDKATFTIEGKNTSNVTVQKVYLKDTWVAGRASLDLKCKLFRADGTAYTNKELKADNFSYSSFEKGTWYLPMKIDERFSCTATYVVTQADIDAKQDLTNEAEVDGTYSYVHQFLGRNDTLPVKASDSAVIRLSDQEPTPKPTEEPTDEPTPEPTEEPTGEPTDEPTPEPTEEPTEDPTDEPTEEPTPEPTEEPTDEPTDEPTEDPAPEPAPAASMKLETLVDGEKSVEKNVDDAATFTMTLENTGEADLHDVTFKSAWVEGKDPLELYCDVDGDFVYANDEKFTLNAGETLNCETEYRMTQEDIDAGKPLKNTVTAEAVTRPASGEPQTLKETDSAEVVPAAVDGQLELIKEAWGEYGDDNSTTGDEIEYVFTVRNTGNVTVSDIEINDPMLAEAGADVVCEDDTLAPNGETECTATYTVTDEDVAEGKTELVNTATVKGKTPAEKDVESDEATATTAVGLPGLAIEKSILDEPEEGFTAGDTVTYSIVVTGTGTGGTEYVTVYDQMLEDRGGELTCEWDGREIANGQIFLDPEDTATCTGSITVTEEDVEAGKPIVNTAEARGSYNDVDAETVTATAEFTPAAPEQPEPTEEPTDQPTDEPTEEPTEQPTGEPTDTPTEEPTEEPTDGPTEGPTEGPEPTDEPTTDPTDEPTDGPTEGPEPTTDPTTDPTEQPEPTEGPEPTEEPTTDPTGAPTGEPTDEPTEEPTPEPTEQPEPKKPELSLTKLVAGPGSGEPVSEITLGAGENATFTITGKNTGEVAIKNVYLVDTWVEGKDPLVLKCTVDDKGVNVADKSLQLQPGESVTCVTEYTVTAEDVAAQQDLVNKATIFGDGVKGEAEARAVKRVTLFSMTAVSRALQAAPEASASGEATIKMAPAPTPEPTEPEPTDEPTDQPTGEPTDTPTGEPTDTPTEEPTEQPDPTEEPTTDPTDEPTEEPTDDPTGGPTEGPAPTDEPTDAPTDEPTTDPTGEPTEEPTDQPTGEPTDTPTDEPTDAPTGEPSQDQNVPAPDMPGGDNSGDNAGDHTGGPGSGSLAQTGAQVAGVIGIAAVLVILGLVLTIIMRRRNQ